MNLTLFDLDGTLIEIDSDHAFGDFMVAVGWVDGAARRRRNDAFYDDYQAARLDIDAYIDFAGCVGIAGSTRLGRHCMIGGAAMIAGHLDLADGVVVSGGTLISKSIREPGIYTGVYPFEPNRRWTRNAATLRHLEEMRVRIIELERRLPDSGKTS